MKSSQVLIALLATSLLNVPAMANTPRLPVEAVNATVQAVQRNKETTVTPAVKPADSVMILDDTPENRRNLALRYVQSQAFKDLNHKILESFTGNLPPSANTLLKDTDQMLNSQELETLTVDLLSKHFSATELEYMYNTENSPEGRAITDKMPAFMSEFMPRMLTIVMQHFTGNIPTRACPLPPDASDEKPGK